jgi:hypothetical protein
MKVPDHLYVLGEACTCHTIAAMHIIFMRIGCTLLTSDMYMSRLRHINDPVLPSLKMECIRLLIFSPTPTTPRAHTRTYVTRFKVNISRSIDKPNDVTICRCGLRETQGRSE